MGYIEDKKLVGAGGTVILNGSGSVSGADIYAVEVLSDATFTAFTGDGCTVPTGVAISAGALITARHGGKISAFTLASGQVAYYPNP